MELRAPSVQANGFLWYFRRIVCSLAVCSWGCFGPSTLGFRLSVSVSVFRLPRSRARDVLVHVRLFVNDRRLSNETSSVWSFQLCLLGDCLTSGTIRTSATMYFNVTIYQRNVIYTQDVVSHALQDGEARRCKANVRSAFYRKGVVLNFCSGVFKDVHINRFGNFYRTIRCGRFTVNGELFNGLFA